MQLNANSPERGKWPAVARKPKLGFEQLWAVDFLLASHKGNFPNGTAIQQTVFHVSLAGFMLAVLQATVILASSVFVS